MSQPAFDPEKAQVLLARILDWAATLCDYAGHEVEWPDEDRRDACVLAFAEAIHQTAEELLQALAPDREEPPPPREVVITGEK